MDFELPNYMLEIERAHKDFAYGRFPLELVKSNWQIVKLIGTTVEQVKFRDDNSALLYMVDRVKSNLSPGTNSLSVMRNSAGNITQVNVMTAHEFNFDGRSK